MAKKAVKFPKIDWSNLDCTPTLLAIAGDLAANIRKRIEQGEVTPPLAKSTIDSKTRRGLSRPKAPLYATGMMRDHISHRKVEQNHVQIYIKDRQYTPTVKGKANKNKRIIRKSWSGGMKKGGEFKDSPVYKSTSTRYPSTNDVAFWHDRKGCGKKRIIRPFFRYTKQEYETAFKLRVKQSFKAAVARVLKGVAA